MNQQTNANIDEGINEFGDRTRGGYSSPVPSTPEPINTEIDWNDPNVNEFGDKTGKQHKRGLCYLILGLCAMAVSCVCCLHGCDKVEKTDKKPTNSHVLLLNAKNSRVNS